MRFCNRCLCEFAGQLQVALELLAELQVQGVQLNVIAYDSAMSACEESSDQRRLALAMLAELREQCAWPTSCDHLRFCN